MGGYVVVSSITYAYKGRDILERKGCRVRVERAPKEISSCGCHFLLMIRNYPLQQAVALLDAAHVRIIKSGGDYNDLL
ncbi:putative Se/S carrier-like protein [Ethanoligenens sp.]|uniref:putative Se/S carrier-like protein n=1 Tax=Ethanoligenens sp. TaxID=2099655 RepID=UPI0039E7B1B6